MKQALRHLISDPRIFQVWARRATAVA